MTLRVGNTEKFQQGVLANAFKEDGIHLKTQKERPQEYDSPF